MDILCVFFFSSRRRHTRLQGDWSSDVCSSDLYRRTCRLVSRRVSGVERVGKSFDNDAEEIGGLLFTEPPDHRGRQSRSEERRGGKEGRSRWSPDHLKKKRINAT